MTIADTILNTRTYRRFDNSHKISIETLEGLINLGRLSGSGRNAQPWQYALINDTELCSVIFPHIGWAGYLSDWRGPVENERPSAYILCILNNNWTKGTKADAMFDLGIASQSMLVGATELGLGGCRIGAFSPKVTDHFNIEDNSTLELIIALGKPVEQIEITECEDDNIKYYRDEKQTHYVPKRTLKDIIVSV